MFSLPGEMSLATLTLPEMTVRLSASVLLGAVLGWDRERGGKPAGLRTHIMVTLGAALFVILGVELLAGPSGRFSQAQMDPTRVLEGVVGGIGFLGAGTIIRSGGNVEGVTTASTIWICGALGAACGLGYYLLSLLGMGFALLTLMVLGAVEHRLNNRRKGITRSK